MDQADASKNGAGGERGRPRLLLVDDEPDLLSTLAEILEHHGYAVVSTLDGEDAVHVAQLYQPNVLVTDFSLPGIDGVTTIRRIREERPGIKAILVSGYLSGNTRERARAEEVDTMLEKPVSVPELLARIGASA